MTEQLRRWMRKLDALPPLIWLILITGLGLGLRLLVWQWHEQYPLGGDENEYLNQALTLLRERRYVELKLMRPPLYTIYLSGCIYLFDSLIQRLRLIQSIISAFTIVPVYLLAFKLFRDRRGALIGALLAAANYTLAANATELLTETLFVFGLTWLFWLLLRAGQVLIKGRVLLYAGLAGLTLGALVLLRSVALPLLPLGGLWLLATRSAAASGRSARSIVYAVVFVLCTLLVITPWTIRNQITYGEPILVDTTGAENLWLDNDPAGREVVKRQLYSLGDDRAARQRLALSRGTAVIRSDPQRFLLKAWGEATRFFALQYFDDMRERRAIWVPPPEVWLRLLCGDGLWLVLLIGGSGGLWLAPRYQEPGTSSERWITRLAEPRWLFVPWVLYTLVTALIFHVELRYRLPIYPVLFPYAAWVLCSWRHVLALRVRPWRSIGNIVTIGSVVGLMLLHHPYPTEAWRLVWKHIQLQRAERALSQGAFEDAVVAANEARRWDPESALSHIVLARAAFGQGDQSMAMHELDRAQSALPPHPYAHLLRGALLRRAGQLQAARQELGYETASLEDLQAWLWRQMPLVEPPPSTLDIGGGLDLGFVRDFYAPEQDGVRWTRASSHIALTAPPGARVLTLRIAAPRPPALGPPNVSVLINGQLLGRFQPDAVWRSYQLPAQPHPGPLLITIQSDVYRPHDHDRTSPDGRTLGVMIERIEVK